MSQITIRNWFCLLHVQSEYSACAQSRAQGHSCGWHSWVPHITPYQKYWNIPFTRLTPRTIVAKCLVQLWSGSEHPHSAQHQPSGTTLKVFPISRAYLFHNIMFDNAGQNFPVSLPWRSLKEGHANPTVIRGTCRKKKKKSLPVCFIRCQAGRSSSHRSLK